MTKLQTASLALICVLLTTAAQIALKVGVSTPDPQKHLLARDWLGFGASVLATRAVLLGLVLYVASVAGWLVVLARADVSYAYPFVSIGFVITLVYAAIFLGEEVSVTRVAGTLFIVAGVLLISRS